MTCGPIHGRVRRRDMLRACVVVKALPLSAIFATVLVFAGLGAGSAEPACPAPASGDTILVTGVTAAGALTTENGEEVLLAGLAFPQAFDVTGKSAGDALRATAIATGPARMAPAGSPDRYGRIHADVVSGHGTWLQAELVTDGLALVRPEGDPACVRTLAGARAGGEGSRRGAVGRLKDRRQSHGSVFAFGQERPICFGRGSGRIGWVRVAYGVPRFRA